MRSLKVITTFVIAIVFFLTVRLNTKGYLVTPEFIDSATIDKAIEQLKTAEDDFIYVDRDIYINDIINWKISEQALISKSEELGITLSDEEIAQHINEQIIIFEDIVADEESGFAEFLEQENLTLEEYFWDFTYEEIIRQMLYNKLMENFINEDNNEYDFEGYHDLLMKIENDFRSEHKKQIKLLRMKYGVEDVEQPPPFFEE